MSEFETEMQWNSYIKCDLNVPKCILYLKTTSIAHLNQLQINSQGSDVFVPGLLVRLKLHFISIPDIKAKLIKEENNQDNPKSVVQNIEDDFIFVIHS